LWDFIVRLRTWLIGTIGLLAVFLPDLIDLAAQLLNAPQIAAVLPEGWKTWAAAIGFIALVWSRWRPASRAADPEVKVAKALKKVDDPAVVVVEAGGETKAVIDA
ncbi:MAG TPA: hypothetical protein VEC60_09820, partial [Reyranella sp.]|nr:hypothetical protein [Reyranella sp.]